MARRVLETLSLTGTRSLRLPVITWHADRPGPTVVITANLHGDECTGIGACHALDREAAQRLECGRLVLYPSLNPEGLERNTRKLPVDDVDPNRLFPGDAAGAPSEQHVAALWRDLASRQPNVVVDLHCDAAGVLPYVLVDRAVDPSRRALEDSSTELAETSGLTVMHDYEVAVYARFALERSLSGAVLNELGVPGMTLEVGPRRILDRQSVDVAAEAVGRVLVHVGLFRGPMMPPHPTRLPGGPWRRESGPRTRHPGLLLARCATGEAVGMGTALADVVALDGSLLETIHSTCEGHVVGYPDRAHVPAGLACVTLAVRDA